jgi:hypothetical protein
MFDVDFTRAYMFVEQTEIFNMLESSNIFDVALIYMGIHNREHVRPCKGRLRDNDC